MWGFYLLVIVLLTVTVFSLAVVWCTPVPECILGTSVNNATSDRIGLTQALVDFFGFALAISGIWYTARQFAKPRLDLYLADPNLPFGRRTRNNKLMRLLLPSPEAGVRTAIIQLVLVNKGNGHAVFYSFTLRDPTASRVSEYEALLRSSQITDLFYMKEYWSVSPEGITFHSKGQIVCLPGEELSVGRLQFLLDPKDQPKVYKIEVDVAYDGKKPGFRPKPLQISVLRQQQ